MAYCGPQGIPHSHFLGGPLRWTAADRDKALAWRDRQARIHAACGTDPDDWNPAKGGDRNAFEFIPTVCPGCERKEQAEAALNSQDWAGQRGKYLTRRRRQPAADRGGDRA